jgi:RNA polymerase sigma-70 factor (ECF subfamily)
MSDFEADRVLLDRIRNDEPGAFDTFVQLHGDRIYGFGMRVCGEREDARDVVQDTLLQAFRSLKKLDEPRALRSWLYRVAANACLMNRRKGKFEPRQELSLEELIPRGVEDAVADVPDVTDLPDDVLARHELQQKVRRAIDTLPAHYRIVLVMRDMEQLSTKETSNALQLPESTVKMRLHRARLKVRQHLVEHPEAS